MSANRRVCLKEPKLSRTGPCANPRKGSGGQGGHSGPRNSTAPAPSVQPRQRSDYYNDDLDDTATVDLLTSKVDIKAIDNANVEHDIHKALQLYLGAPVDTTDRSLVQRAQKERFDPHGFRQTLHRDGEELQGKDALRKDIFYRDPYITCRYCNHLAFVDVVTIRRMQALPLEVSLELCLPPEVLPPCVDCGHIDCFVVGSHDFAEEVNARKKKEEEELRIQTAASIRLQRAYRRYLLRMYGSALSDAFLAERYLKHTAALKINSVARGRLARRIRVTKSHLVTIKASHPLVIKWAMRSQVGRPKVFWYKRQVELDMLYDNYLELVERTGFVPARLLVERNVAEMARRVVERKSMLIVLVQRRWRGFMARRMVQFYRTEIIRLFQSSVCRVMKIQAAYRGHAARLLIPKVRREQRREKVLNNYLGRGRDQLLLQQRDTLTIQAKAAYVRERAEERTARYASMTPTPDQYGLRKMEAFWDSQFADDQLGRRSDQLLRNQAERQTLERRSVEEEQQRKAFVLARVAELGPLGFGLRSVPLESSPRQFYVEQFWEAVRAQQQAEQRREEENKNAVLNQGDTVLSTVLPKYDLLSDAQASRCKGMRKYFEAELKRMSEALLERVQHDYSSDRRLLQRFQEHNQRRMQPNNLREVARDPFMPPGGGAAAAASGAGVLVVRRQHQEMGSSLAPGSDKEVARLGAAPSGKLKSSLVQRSVDVSSSGGSFKQKGSKKVVTLSEHIHRGRSSAKVDAGPLDSQQQQSQLVLGAEGPRGRGNEEADVDADSYRKEDNRVAGPTIPDGQLVVVEGTDSGGEEEGEEVGEEAEEVPFTRLADLYADDDAGGVGFSERVEASVKELRAEPVVKNVPRHVKGNFKFPAHVHFDAMAWLYENHEDTI